MQEQPSILAQIGNYFYELFNVRKGLDWISTVSSIRNKVSLQGENIWMLICSTMIASIGLNLNSGAVIIGAMLISPLMSPILGIGLGMGINDRELLLKAFKSFAVATIFSILTSVIFFKFLTPFKEAGSEILSRTNPTILDAMVAIFGGTAGIIAVSRKDKGAAIPGVAIATALMPPLCVAGYGLATGNFTFFTNAFYLFFLNSMLIAFATFMIVRFLGFPLKEHQTDEGKRKATIAISVFIVALMIPGVLILQQVLREKRKQDQISAYFSSKFNNPPENQMVGQFVEEHNMTGDTLYYTVTYKGREISEDELQAYNQELSEITGKVSFVDPVMLNLSSKKIELFNSKNAQFNTRLSEQAKKEAVYQQQISSLQKTIDSLYLPVTEFSSLEREIETLWPELEEFRYGTAIKKKLRDTLQSEEKLFVITWQEDIPKAVRKDKREQLERYLSTKFEEKTVEIIEK